MEDIETAKQLFFDGLAQLEKNDFAAAERLFVEALAFAPRSVSVLSNLAIAQFKQKKFVECGLTARRLIAVEARNIDGYDILSSCQKELGQYADALSSCDKIIEIDPTIAEAHSNRAHLLNALSRYPEAIASSKRALAIRPAFADAYLHCGNALQSLERHAEALAAYDQALSVGSDLTHAWFGRGNALWCLRRYDEALAAYDKALAIEPDLAGVWLGRGDALYELKRHDEALAAYDKALSVKPDSAGAWLGRGNVFWSLKRYDEALAAYDKALSVRSDFAGAWLGRGNALTDLKRFDEAFAAYDKAQSIAPDLAGAWLGRGNVLYELKRHDEALAAYDKALSVAPDLAGVWLGRGNVFWSTKRYDQACAAYDKALAIDPDAANAWLGRGNAFFDLKRYDEALAAYGKALAIEPDLAVAWLGRGSVFADLKRFDDAIAAYDKATAMNPDLGEAHVNAAHLRLLLGDTDIGFQKYEYRWATRQQRDRRRNFSQPIWLGDSDISNATILIHAEQGFGDTLMCCRYIPMIGALGARVILEVQPALMSLLRDLQGVSTVIAKGAEIPHFDLHCPMMSLPLAFKTTVDTIPRHVPYLFVATDMIERWRPKLAGTGMKVGIAWAGSPHFIKDADRSVLLKNILPLLAVDGASYFCLQKDLREGDEDILNANPRIVRLDREISDFRDTAAVMMSLDVIISSDTSLANLGGALGGKVWVLLPSIPDWRWSLDRDDTPWYPTATLFRQKKIGDWSTVVKRASDELKKLVARELA